MRGNAQYTAAPPRMVPSMKNPAIRPSHIRTREGERERERGKGGRGYGKGGLQLTELPNALGPSVLQNCTGGTHV